MYYIFTAAGAVLLIFLFYRILSASNEPDFTLKGLLSEESLILSVISIASASAKTEKSGKGLSLRLIKKYTDKCRRLLDFEIFNNLVGEGGGADPASGGAFEFENRLYDNFYVIRDHLAITKKQLKNLYFLPHYNGLPRIYWLCQLLVKTTEGAVSPQLIKRAVNEFNAITPLNYQEIKYLPACLRYALLEFLAIYCSKTAAIADGKQSALRDIKKRRVDLNGLTKNSYIYFFLQYSDAELTAALENICEKNDIDTASKREHFIHLMSSYNGAVEYALHTLCGMETWLTDEYLIRLSELHRLFEGEGVTYKECTLPTKNVYLHYLSKAAHKAKIGELAYGRRVIESAQKDGTDIAAGILPRAGSKNAQRIYIAAILFFSAALCVLTAFFLSGTQIVSAVSIILALLAFPSAVAATLMVANELSARFIFRRYLPRVNLTEKTPQTLIVYCALAASKEELKQLFFSLQILCRANPQPFFRYGLLLDFPAGEEIGKNDAELSDECARLFTALGEEKDRYNIWIRKRKKIEGQNRWQGWEKKRGALMELNQNLLNGETDRFSLILGEPCAPRYAITLDSDTMLNSAAELVEIMEHPFNSTKFVVSLTAKTNPYNVGTRFARLMCGDMGLNSYDSANANLNYDLFDSGNYTGKGIYRVKEFNEKLTDFFPDGRVLSHDFIEGAVCGCGVSECAVDCYPSTFSQYVTRSIRWLRGDWQLLPYLFKSVRTRRRERIKNPVSPIAKWHIFCNMLFSLLPVFSFFSLVAAAFSGSPLWAAAVSLSYYIICFLNTVRVSARRLRLPFARLFNILFSVAVLPVTAFYNLTAILVTLWRLITKKRLLEWKVFAHAKQKISFLPSVIAAAFFAFVPFMRQNYHVMSDITWIFWSFSAFFLIGIPLALYLNKDLKCNKYLPDSLKAELSELAKKTWNYFVVAEEFLHDKDTLDYKENAIRLIPDNLQLHLNKGFAKRTSPTNIGFSVLAAICANKLELISEVEMNKRLDAIIDSIEKLEKWHGCLYNWMDTDGRLLHPKYVSSVDNGNLLACLLTAESCVNGALKTRIKDLIDDMDMGKLYDERRGLIRIGYNETDKRFDGHYDLLASESMLTYLTAIGTGKIPRKAFGNLSSNALKAHGGTALASWSGGMFEYLMSALFFKYPSCGILDLSAKAVIKAHKKYGIDLPFWGCSESQYNYTDGQGNYQYKAFGAPKICNSNQSAGRVVAPYASILALTFDAKSVEKNLKDIRKTGMSGEFGFFESNDDGKPVESYMTHHQGMILAALCNHLCGDALIKELKKHPAIVAAELLITQTGFHGVSKKRRQLRMRKAVYESGIKAAPCLPKRFNFLTNGRYSVAHGADGGGWSAYDGLCLSRNENGCGGLKVFLKHKDSAHDISSQGAYFESYKTVYEYRTPDFFTVQTAMVLSNLDGEVRRVKIRNTSDKPLDFVLHSHFEPVLCRKDEDLSHKLFSSMRIRTYVESGMLFAFRAGAKKVLFAAHYFDINNVKFESNRHNLRIGLSEKCNMKKLPSFNAPLFPVLSGAKNFVLPPGKEAEVSIYIMVSESVDALKNAAKLTKTAAYFKQSTAANFSLGRHLGLRRKYADLGSSILNSPFCDEQNFKRLPVVLIELKYKPEGLKEVFRELRKLQSFVEFNVAVSYRESEGYFHGIYDQILGFLRRAGLENAHILNHNFHTDLIERLKKIAVKPINFTAMNLEKTYPPANFKNTKFNESEYDLPLSNCGFLKDSSFVIERNTPRPWSNVIANGEFGTIITDGGGGYTFYKNSALGKITAWSNDPIDDKPSEGILLAERGVVWSAVKKILKKDCDYSVKHSFGYSEFRCNYNGLSVIQTEFIGEGAIKYYLLNIENAENKAREINTVFFANLVLGDNAENTRGFIEIQEIQGGVKAFNKLNGQTVYLSASFNNLHTMSDITCVNHHTISDITCKNAELFTPPYAAITAKIKLAPYEKTRAIFTLSALPPQPQNEKEIKKALENANNYWQNLSCLQIETPDRALNHLLKWLPYQALSCRFNARAGFYQAGGAIGFRDQLQDCLALLYIDPQRVRAHILDCAAHQFFEGDVQHWWHPPAYGVRTKITDDLLYLPFVAAEYITFTGDSSILMKSVPFLKGRPLADGEKDAYYEAQPGESAPLYEHCVKALLYNEIAENNLVKMGGGDWNDAMDKVGEKGIGTSVFNSMFLYFCIGKFLPFIRDPALRGILLDRRALLKRGVDAAWDGEWFLRAFADDGVVLGSKKSAECKIDLLTQSWASLSKIADPRRTKIALRAAADRLIDYKNGVIKLLSPPFEHIDAGYISKYPKGVRENGGQYTHAAAWYIMALLQEGSPDFAWTLLQMLNPVNHCRDEKGINAYMAEPYVLCGDVYSGEFSGTAGWSWYTGAAGWYYKCVIENLLGLSIKGNKLYITPNLPQKLPYAKIKYKTDFGEILINIDNSDNGGNSGDGEWAIYVGEVKYSGNYILVTPSIVGKVITVRRD